MSLQLSSFCLALILPVALLPTFVRAESAQQSSRISSETDNLLKLTRVTLAPVTDNTDGIYARPVENKLRDLVSRTYRWDFIEGNFVGGIQTINEFEENPDSVQKLTKALQAEGLISARIIKTPQNIQIQLGLFLGADGKLIVKETTSEIKKFEISEILSQLERSYKLLLERLPFRGYVLSRIQNKVTLNLGAKDGIRPGDPVSAILVLSLRRHPKQNFMVAHDKEVLGQIRIDKVEDSLSFGTITFEKERGVIQKLTKIGSNLPVQYSPSIEGGTTQGEFGIDSSAGFGGASVPPGDLPQVWVPVDPPTFGKVSFLFGLGSFSANTLLATSGSVEGNSNFVPSLKVNGEIWITPQWIVRAGIQNVPFSISNPLPGSSPSRLNMSATRYQFHLGYNILLLNDFFGPRVQLLAGVQQFNLYADASSPLALTETTFSGFNLGATAAFPITPDGKYEIGFSLLTFLKPGLSEKPVTSGGASDNSVTQFSVFGSMKMTERFRAFGTLDFDLFKASFTGAGTRVGESALNLSNRMTILSGGIEYLF
ncbi:MAG: hypothetical protein K2X47_08900 [Bdellovibrionales bacterium]|nr:hypothetical protein [Bdellovibrionales bacterium]